MLLRAVLLFTMTTAVSAFCWEGSECTYPRGSCCTCDSRGCPPTHLGTPFISRIGTSCGATAADECWAQP
ncbi:hypothetical protein Ptr902_02916 [Pyrenophora tritici-repentis]|uniref:Uncharacterized protein n=1 Tax=Pyrenophora tritici-repentis TaxID=45151 RepID=A0A5M9L5P4_9PLEO|nr:hypothetical protein PtrV1_07935 [Pyrenophora tritici-repentis]KAF7448977.1 hypothetical protein A1F99_060260 [Pyrenophora tritici-repentis]KAF7571029.1 hypothetical protein PtrM4_110310 [Pyrenophora tritici-repentis]KAI0581396.1 hypothetical protein Alg215_04733 [Pyrenophora tritici-repentis]KAI0584494.1 hypothetical protein Alg130_05163 [Pyrenophora tritici-repentis]